MNPRLQPIAPDTTKSSWLAKASDCYELCKPKVVALMWLTALVGMHLATPHFVPWSVILLGSLGIVTLASSAAAINHLLDRRIDRLMQRTQQRPIASGRITPKQAWLFALVMGCIGFAVLYQGINPLTAWMTLATLFGYAVLYTLFLKYATPQNIVIGGVAGAAPPILGWSAVTGHLDPYSLLLALIIFTWTPPHFWALAIYRLDDYKKAKIPMLPVTHGVPFTQLCILLYTILLFAVSLLPFVTGMSGWFYLLGAVLLGLRFLYWSVLLFNNPCKKVALHTFRFSIHYLMGLFLFLLLDHYVPN